MSSLLRSCCAVSNFLRRTSWFFNVLDTQICDSWLVYLPEIRLRGKIKTMYNIYLTNVFLYTCFHNCRFCTLFKSLCHTVDLYVHVIRIVMLVTQSLCHFKIIVLNDFLSLMNDKTCTFIFVTLICKIHTGYS